MTEDKATPLPPLFVINMAKDQDRRAGITARARAVGVELTFVDAVNGRAMDDDALAAVYDSRKRKRFFGRDMTKGEIGCLLSHRKIYETMVAEAIPLAVILEDDVIFEPDFKDALTALVQAPRHWDVMRFLGSAKIYKRGCRKIAPLGDTRYYFARLPTAPGGAHGYMLTRHAAEIMLTHMRRNWMPIDTLQGRTWETGLETLVLYPAPLYPDPAAESVIGNSDRFDKTPTLTGMDRALYPLTRLWYRLTDTLGKRLTYWGCWFKDRHSA